MSASGTHANTTISYPIAFNSACYSVASTREGTSADGTWNAVIDSVTKSSFRCQLKIGLYWIATGKQQWGCKASAGTNTSVTFPISFKSACYMVLGNMSKPADHGYEVNIYPKHTWSISSFAMYTRNTDSSEFTWIAVGKQQWGSLYIPKEQKLQFVYPLTFTSTAFAIALSNEGTSNTAYASAFSNLTNSSVYLADNAATVHCIIVGVQQWGIWNDNRSAGQIQCTLSVSNTKETLAILATYFDNTEVSNGAILIKETTLSTCKIKLWSYTKISFWVIGYQSYNSISYCSPKSIYVSRT